MPPDESGLTVPTIRSVVTRMLGARLKELFIPKSYGWWGSLVLGQSPLDSTYTNSLGDGLSVSVVMPVVQWLMRAFCEAPLIVQAQQRDEWQTVPEHPLTQLIARPNAFYGSAPLWMATIQSWCWFGEAYWQVLYTQGGQPGELWWLPPWSIDPQWPSDGSQFISHYIYRPDQGTAIRLELDEVVHFRHGLDPRNPRHGLPPLRAVLSDAWADQEASHWVGSLLRNMGVPGLILSPKGETFISDTEMERVKAYVQSRFSGDQRGLPMALGAAIDVHKLPFSPNEFDLSVIRNTGEERVCAALGIATAVVGFGTGLETTKVGATMREMVQQSWTNGIIPVKRMMGDELFRTLLPAFELNAAGFRVSWDFGDVQALQEDENEKAERIVKLVLGGLMKVSEGRSEMGLESTPDDEIYLRPSSVTPTDPKDQMPEPEPLPMPVGAGINGNGNGNGVQQRSLKQGNLDAWLTEIIGQHARRMDHIPQSAIRLAAKLARAQARLGQSYEAQLRQVFQRYAEAAGTAARELLQPLKASVENTVRTAILHERLPITQIRFELAGVYREMYREMLELLSKALLEAGQPEMTDPARVLRNLQMAAGSRAELLDLSGEARTAILSTLESATAAGLSEDDMIAAIKDAVPRGRWTSIEQRAQTMARTESRFSLNIASAGYARDQGLRLLVLDAQLGPTDDTCEIRRGWMVTPAQGEQLSASEHPNGTLQLIGIPSQAIRVAS